MMPRSIQCWRRAVRPATRAACVLIGLAAMLACGADSPVSTGHDLNTLYWSLTNDVKAAVVVVGGTQRVVATPRNAYGDAIPGLPAPTFQSVDPTKVTVTADGLVTGVATTTGTQVIATLTAGGVTSVDTSVVAVTAQRKAIRTFFIRPPVSPTDTLVTINGIKVIPLSVIDSAGAPVTGLALYYKSSNPVAGQILSSFVRGISKGSTTVVVSTTAYGVAWRDSIRYAIIYPTTATIYDFDPATLSPAAAVIGPGGTVTFSNYTSGTINVTFDDSTHVTNGNIASLSAFASQSRTFPTAGTFVFRNTLGTETGTIYVLGN